MYSTPVADMSHLQIPFWYPKKVKHIQTYKVGPPQTVAKLVNITSITIVYDTYYILLL